MKTTIQTVCCALGSGMIGYFANQLDTAWGASLFVFGVLLLAGSIAAICMQKKEKK